MSVVVVILIKSVEEIAAIYKFPITVDSCCLSLCKGCELSVAPNLPICSLHHNSFIINIELVM